MHLTAHQQAMLEGRHGWPQQLGMRMLTAVGRAFDAAALIPVSSVHLSLSGVSVGEPGLKLFESVLARGGRFVVPTTLNILSLDRQHVGTSPALAAKEQVQLRILDACRAMGGLPTCSCNPFVLGVQPRFGENVAWNESATAPYVNAVLGARTNREGATALASALTGYTAAYGMHLDAARRAMVAVEVDADVSGSDRFSLLGGAVAAACGDRIPVLEGLARKPSLDELTSFCAALAAVGPLAMFHVAGMTPEAPTAAAALGRAPAERIRLDARALEREAARYTTATAAGVDLVVMGCPHASLDQIRDVAERLDSQRVHARTTFLLQTSAAIADEACAQGLCDRLARAGVALTRDTCVHVAYREPAAGATLVTDALKIAYLLRSHGLAVRLGTTAQCVRAAVNGAWSA